MHPVFLIPAGIAALFACRMASKGWHGGGKWFLASLVLCAVIVFGFSRVPHSPISCLAHKGQDCAPQGNAILWALAVALLPAFLGTIGRERS